MRYAAEHGCKLFDFTIGDEPYKREWCDVEISRFVSPASWRGSLVAVSTVPFRQRVGSNANRQLGHWCARCGRCWERCANLG